MHLLDRKVDEDIRDNRARIAELKAKIAAMPVHKETGEGAVVNNSKGQAILESAKR